MAEQAGNGAAVAEREPEEVPAERELAVYEPPTGRVTGAPVLQFNAEQREIIRGLIAPDASDDELGVLIAYAKRVGLDPIAKQIYGIPRTSNVKVVTPDGREQWRKERRLTIQTSIDGLRLIAQRTGEYAGRRGPFWCGPDGEWKDVWLSETPPAAARVGVMRHGFVEPLWAVAHWREYAMDNQMWKRMPAGQLAKTAEALGLRSAFPAELSGVYGEEEMAQAERRDTDPTGGTAADDRGTLPRAEPQPEEAKRERQVERPTDIKHALAILEGVGVLFPVEWIKELLIARYGEVPSSFGSLPQDRKNWVGGVLRGVSDWLDEHYEDVDTPIGPAATVEQMREAFASASEGMRLEGPVAKIEEKHAEVEQYVFQRQVELGLRDGETGLFTEKGQAEYGVDAEGFPVEEAQFTPVGEDGQKPAEQDSLAPEVDANDIPFGEG